MRFSFSTLVGLGISLYLAWAGANDAVINATSMLQSREASTPQSKMLNAEKILLNFISKFHRSPNSDNLEVFQQISNLQQSVDALPWSVSSEVYKLVKLSGIAFRLGSFIPSEIPNPFSFASYTSSIPAHPAQIGQAVKEMGESLAGLFELYEISKDLNEIFNSKPGTPLEILAVDYLVFVELFQNIEKLRMLDIIQSQVLQKEISQIKFEVFAQSLIPIAQISRQIAGIKKVPGGKALAFHLEALVATSLAECSTPTRNLLIEHWAKNSEIIAKKTESFFNKSGRKILHQEISEFTSDIKAGVENIDSIRKRSSSAYGVKLSMVTLGIMQLHFKSATTALDFLEQSNTHLKQVGIENTVLNKLAVPIAETSNWVRKGIDGGITWGVNSIDFTEKLLTKFPSAINEAVSKSSRFILDLNTSAISNMKSGAQKSVETGKNLGNFCKSVMGKLKKK